MPGMNVVAGIASHMHIVATMAAEEGQRQEPSPEDQRSNVEAEQAARCYQVWGG